MINRLLTVLLFAIGSFSISAQSQVESMLKDAELYNMAYVKGDIDKFVDMTIPSVVEIAGGREIMIDNAKKEYEMTNSGGVITAKISPEKPEKIMIAGDNLHAILPQVVLKSIGETKFSQTIYFLASSADEGKSWTFLNLEAYDMESIKIFVPSFTGEIEIPIAEEPKIIE